MSQTERFKRGREEEEEEEENEFCEKRFRFLTAEGEELLHLLEDVESCGEKNEDLVNGVMKILEEEIGVGLNADVSSVSCSEGSEVESGGNCSPQSRIDLGYLLEASDDELGIPPTVDSSSDECCCRDILENPSVPVKGEFEGLALWPLEDYGPLEFEYDVNRFNEVEAERGEVVNPLPEYLLFEYSDVDQSWRREAACGI
ncbi:hypothetical protein SUGI_0108930 [Cryptomeria japonica]|uniref:uncharacterized protein LOC131050584 n=1 Tax=Cryptomeria japonica TaxID=3369 RepID=UPI002408DCBC|nr:uncharacterized protein LOC131050584 [Cryptomeria japonica]GLJ09410.1 hypothetical protein SUGI_0108930 [Cryptomeria japonica]